MSPQRRGGDLEDTAMDLYDVSECTEFEHIEIPALDDVWDAADESNPVRVGGARAARQPARPDCGRILLQSATARAG